MNSYFKALKLKIFGYLMENSMLVKKYAYQC